VIDHKCEIIGTKGVLYLDPTHNAAIAKYTTQTPAGYPAAAFSRSVVTPEIHGKQMGFGVESIYHFVDCLRDGRQTADEREDGLFETRG